MAKYITAVTGNTAQLIGKVIKPRDADAYYGQITITGNFDSGTCAIQYSADGGTTKVSLINPLTGSAYALTANGVVALNPLGANHSLSGASLLYATPTGASAALTVTLEDNR